MRSSLALALVALPLTIGCGLVPMPGPGAAAPSSGAGSYTVPKESQDTVRAGEARSDAITDPQLDAQYGKQETDVQHALAFALGREGMAAGMPPAESSSQALAELRKAHFKLRIEPVTNAQGGAVADNFVQLKDSFTDRLQGLQQKLVAGTATAAERAEVMRGAKQVLKLNALRMQVSNVSRAAVMTNSHVQTQGLSTMLQIAGMVRVRKQMSMDWTDADYARVAKILAREKKWDALAAATMGMLAAYEAVIGSGGDPKALDAIADSTLKAFPLDVQVSADDAKDYVAHLSDGVAAQKAKYEAWMRGTYGDKVYEAQYKAGIDAMFAQAAGASSQKSATQMVADTNAKYQADLAKCARGEPLDPGSLVGPGKCKETREQALAGGGGGEGSNADGSAGPGVPLPAGAKNAVDKVGKGLAVAQAAASGDTAGALEGAADMFPGDGPIHASLSGVAALMKGDVKGALKSALSLAQLVPGGGMIKEGLGIAGKLLKLFG